MGVSEEEVGSMDGRAAQIRSLLHRAEVQAAAAEIVTQLQALNEPAIDRRLEKLGLIAEGYPDCAGLDLYCGGTK
jgi:hypothetical protein